MDRTEGYMFVVFGLFTMFCSFMDYDFFMKSNKARFFVNLLGRDGTRVLYLVIGFFLMVAGFALTR